MPIRRSRKGKARRPRRAMGGRMRSRGGPSAGPSLAPSGRMQYASIVESIYDDTGVAPNTLYSCVFSLSQFARAKALACQFQFYRAKKVTYTYTPLYNTFQEGVSGFSKPYMYLQMNRTQQFILGGLPELQHSGARPKPFTSVIKLTYTPNWCSGGLVAQTNVDIAPTVNIGLQKQYGWLSCPFSDNGSTDQTEIVEGAQTTASSNIDIPAIIPNCVVYNGHIAYVDQTGSTAGLYKCVIQVHWEFKGAHYSPQKGSS